jgi:hypothetical protein
MRHRADPPGPHDPARVARRCCSVSSSSAYFRSWRQDREHWLAVTKKYARDSGGWKWNREELYEERLERHQKPSA